MRLYNSFVGIPHKIKLATKFFFILVILFYFIFHAINGKNGMRYYVTVKKQVAEQSELLNKLKSQKESLEKKISLLGNKALDLDMLEERCRIVLNYAMSDDIIIKESTIY